MIDAIKKFYFAEAMKNSSEVNDQDRVEGVVLLINTELELYFSIVFENYMRYMKRDEDVARLMTFFNKKF